MRIRKERENGLNDSLECELKTIIARNPFRRVGLKDLMERGERLRIKVFHDYVQNIPFFKDPVGHAFGWHKVHCLLNVQCEGDPLCISPTEQLKQIHPLIKVHFLDFSQCQQRQYDPYLSHSQ